MAIFRREAPPLTGASNATGTWKKWCYLSWCMWQQPEKLSLWWQKKDWQATWPTLCIYVDRYVRGSSAATVGQLLEAVEGGTESAVLSSDVSECSVGAVLSQWPHSCRRPSLPAHSSRHFQPLLLHLATQDTCRNWNGKLKVVTVLQGQLHLPKILVWMSMNWGPIKLLKFLASSKVLTSSLSPVCIAGNNCRVYPHNDYLAEQKIRYNSALTHSLHFFCMTTNPKTADMNCKM